MLQPEHCYLRLLTAKYHRQIAQCLGQYPTIDQVLDRDSFMTAYMSGPFMTHISKSRKENPFYLGTLRRLAGGMPVRVGAKKNPDVEMVEMSLAHHISKKGKQVDHTSTPIKAIKHPTTESQNRLLQAAQDNIRYAQKVGLEPLVLQRLESQYNTLAV